MSAYYETLMTFGSQNESGSLIAMMNSDLTIVTEKSCSECKLHIYTEGKSDLSKEGDDESFTSAYLPSL